MRTATRTTGATVTRATGASRRRARWSSRRTSRTSSSSSSTTRADADSGTRTREAVDAALSNRRIALDPAGYFLIAVDRARMEICANHHANVIGEDGLARDPRTGEVIPCDGSYSPPPPTRFRGRTAKELSVEILERGSGEWCSMMSHANYLGREFQRAEACMTSGEEYVQD